jgi:hypothetical protein
MVVVVGEEYYRWGSSGGRDGNESVCVCGRSVCYGVVIVALTDPPPPYIYV